MALPGCANSVAFAGDRGLGRCVILHIMLSSVLRRTSTVIAVTSLSTCGGMLAAQTVGATPGANTPALSPPALSGAETGAPTKTPASSHRTQVVFHDGLLTVTAQDSSLNAVLHEIARQTGMRISGGVRDDRVFGSYGPATPSAVLSTLIEGTGSNMLLVNNAADAPAELILTPRLGGPTPPSPNGAAPGSGEDEDGSGAAPPIQQPVFGGQPPPQSFSGRPAVQPSSSLTPPISSPTTNNSDSQSVVFPPVNSTSTAATGTTSSDTTQEPPSGIKTPQQIFEQLQKLRQQQEQTQTPSPQ